MPITVHTNTSILMGETLPPCLPLVEACWFVAQYAVLLRHRSWSSPDFTLSTRFRTRCSQVAAGRRRLGLRLRRLHRQRRRALLVIPALCRSFPQELVACQRRTEIRSVFLAQGSVRQNEQSKIINAETVAVRTSISQTQVDIIPRHVMLMVEPQQLITIQKSAKTAIRNFMMESKYE